LRSAEDNLKPLEVELKRLEDSVAQIHQEMKFLQQREQQMRSTNGTAYREGTVRHLGGDAAN
jgi:phage shock protein A